MSLELIMNMIEKKDGKALIIYDQNAYTSGLITEAFVKLIQSDKIKTSYDLDSFAQVVSAYFWNSERECFYEKICSSLSMSIKGIQTDLLASLYKSSSVPIRLKMLIGLVRA